MVSVARDEEKGFAMNSDFGAIYEDYEDTFTHEVHRVCTTPLVREDADYNLEVWHLNDGRYEVYVLDDEGDLLYASEQDAGGAADMTAYFLAGEDSDCEVFYDWDWLYCNSDWDEDAAEYWTRCHKDTLSRAVLNDGTVTIAANFECAEPRVMLFEPFFGYVFGLY